MRLQRGKVCRRRLEESGWSEEDGRVVDKGGGRELWLWMKGGRTSDKKTAGRTTVSTFQEYKKILNPTFFTELGHRHIPQEEHLAITFLLKSVIKVYYKNDLIFS